MPLLASSLSKVCRSIADFVGAQLNAVETAAFVTLGNPGDAVPGESEGHRLNVFFFRFESFNFDADLLPGETWLIRMHCMITPFAVLEDSVSAGENDLRLVGEVLRMFHENPVFTWTIDGDDFLIQIIPQNLGLDQINQLWSTQGDLAYRPSLLYEVSLAPVIPNTKAVASPKVGALGLGVRADIRATTGASSPAAPDVQPITVKTAQEDWAPAIAFVLSGNCAQSLSYAVGNPALSAPFQVWIAGLPAAAVALRWEIWNSATGWTSVDPTLPATASSASIDPARAASATTRAVTLPVATAGQVALYAERTYTRAVDGASLTVRSNPLLVSIYEAAP